LSSLENIKPKEKETKMATNKMSGRMVGVLYIIGTVSGFLSLVFSASLLDGSDYLAKIAANDTQLVIAALCVLMMGLSLALIPIIAFPVLRKQNETLARGYLVFRSALETVGYFVTVSIWLLLIPVSQEYVKASGADVAGYQAVGTLLEKAPNYMGSVATFFFIIGAVMFYSVLYQSKLVPRWLSGWGLLASVPSLASATLVLFGVIESLSTAQKLLEAPLGVQEMVLAVWLIVRGFNASVPVRVVRQDGHTPGTLSTAARESTV
jgi:hypothetical protein